MVPFSGMYDALKAKTFDGQSDPLGVVLSLRLYEVQRYLSLTAHWWTGFTLLANARLPGTRCRPRSRRSSSATPNLPHWRSAPISRLSMPPGPKRSHGHGMLVNTADTDSIRGRLGEFYARWRARFDPAVWMLLEEAAGGLPG